MKRVFGIFEVIFDALYLIAAFIFSFMLFFIPPFGNIRILAGVMALILAGGDFFHLFPRMKVIITHQEERYRPALGRGKQITSITMTIFYLFLWQIGLLIYPFQDSGFFSYLIYLLAAVRILLCLMPYNRWQDRYPPVKWGIWRNVPFFLMGAAAAIQYFVIGHKEPGLTWMWLAIILSFTFYLPVVLWSNKNPKIGMLMLPKTCAYLWMLVMFLFL